ncbi:hypothetical protein HN358_03545 [Candidatus Uhrbacteria bacterium]|jgi:hypothetical protein|nr:hypothetical protein [Candidatus Uhrbacteria bacterium]MBT7717210.1 hypothetical protein [Candidatus Uhrbacteria bacterium]
MGIKKWLQGMGLIAMVGTGDGVKPVRLEDTDEPARSESIEQDTAYAEVYDTAEIAHEKAGELKSEAQERESQTEVAEADFEPMHESEPKGELRESKVEERIDGEKKKIA